MSWGRAAAAFFESLRVMTSHWEKLYGLVDVVSSHVLFDEKHGTQRSCAMIEVWEVKL